MADAVWQRCALTTSTMTVILGWNSLQNWLACPVHTPWMHQTLPQGRHGLGPPPGIAEGGTVTRAGGGPGAAFAPQPCLSFRIPPIPALTFAPHASRTGKHPCCFRHASPRCHGHTCNSVGREHSALVPEGCSDVVAVWIQQAMEQPHDSSLWWQWPFLSTSKCHVRLEVRCRLSHHNSKSSPVSPGLR